MIRKISKLLYRFAQWFEARFVPYSREQDLKDLGMELRGDDVYYEGRKVGTRYIEGDDK